MYKIITQNNFEVKISNLKGSNMYIYMVEFDKFYIHLKCFDIMNLIIYKNYIMVDNCSLCKK